MLARRAARVLVLHRSAGILLLEAIDVAADHRWWVAPGGGLEEGETFEAAAARELYEETGLDDQIGSWVWTRHHTFDVGGRRFEQHERFFVARTEKTEISPVRRDAYVVSYRWWSVEAIRRSPDDFAPRRIAELLSPLLRGEYPQSPIDCGI